jgi:arginyl-tRNA synthetase
MKSVLKELNEAFNAAIRTAMPIATENALVAPCGKLSMGHYQCNSAMSLFGKYKGQDGCPKNPRAASDLIVAALKEQNHPMIGKVDVAGPGFINVFLKEDFLNERVKVYLQDHVPPPPIAKRLRCIVDFSSPNIAKEMHVGHLRSTIIGDTICRVLEHVGHDVVRVNHVVRARHLNISLIQLVDCFILSYVFEICSG